MAALIGREFSAEVLAMAAGMDEDTLVPSLDELWRRRIVREKGAASGGGTYDFSHDKIREVAARSVSPARRRQLHLRIATALERTSPIPVTAAAAPRSVQIAAHYQRAGAAERAATWYRSAANAAALLHANTQAIALLDQALGLLGSLPESPRRDALELEMRTARLAPLASVEGYASPGVSATQRRARELTEALGVDEAPSLLRSLALSALSGSDFTSATRYGQRLRAAGERDDVLAVEAAYVLGIAAFWQAEFATARHHFELAVTRYRPADRRTHLIRYGQDPKVVCLSRLGNTLWFLGLPDDARAARSAGLAWAEEIAHPYSRAAAMVFAALLALDMDDDAELRRYTEALAAAEPEAPPVRLATDALLGSVAVLDGAAGEGIAAIRAAIQRIGAQERAPGLAASLGRILLAACQAAGDATAVIAAAGALLEQGGAACVWAPQARRAHAAFPGSRG
ncbi:MAG TPA: hypothetical protein VFO16_08280 [Pseudonocardiaceae bacterium]|nr:hypothetical protein [Pseudonocardiaceae bacterium]